MANFFNTAKKILKDYDYLHYKQIVDLALERGGLHTDGKTPELTMASRLGSDIRQKGINSTFIRIGDGIFSLRKSFKEDNLLIYLKYRLKDDNLWLINEKDERYLLDIFGKNIFNDEKIELLDLLDKLVKNKKISDYKKVGDDLIINLEEEKINISDDLKKKIKILNKESDEFKELSKKISENAGLKELAQKLNIFQENLKSVLPQITKNGLLNIDKKTFVQFDKLGIALSGMYKNPIIENFGEIFKGLQESLKLYDVSKLNSNEIGEFNRIQSQIKGFNQLLINPETFLASLSSLDSTGYTLPNKSGNNIGNFTHGFEGYYQEGDFKTIRGFAHIQDLASISKAIYFNNGGIQRNEDKERCLKIKKYIESGNKRFFPEVILGLYINDGGVIKIENSTKGDDRKNLSGLSKDIKSIYINLNKLKDGTITRIDGNHRLFFADKIEKDFLVPFCFVIFDQRGESEDIEEIYKNQEANIFYLLNGKNKPVTSEEALQVLLNIPDDEAQSLYQNDSTLGLTRVCKEKYDNFCIIGQSFKDNFGELPYTKFEKLVLKIEKLGKTNVEIVNLIELIFETIHHLGSEYKEIIKRKDFLILVLEVVLDNKEKEADKRNIILKSFFDWILREGLEEISSSEKPILWELFNKNKSYKDTFDIHIYQIDENKFDGDDMDVSYRKFFADLYLSRDKIKIDNKDEKVIGLKLIQATYLKLLDIIGGGKTENRQRVKSFIGKHFNTVNKPKLKTFLENHLYDTVGNRIHNNDFDLKHNETDKESLEDKQFIEFLYCEYDNAIKFILDKECFLIK